jgi:hypothetical protein
MKLYWTYISLEFLICEATEACHIMFVCLSPCNNLPAKMIKPDMNTRQLEATTFMLFNFLPLMTTAQQPRDVGLAVQYCHKQQVHEILCGEILYM